MNDLLVIFIIEDSKIISSLMSNLLSREFDVTVFTFESGESALETLNSVTPDIILLDYHLDSRNKHNINGQEFMTILKKLKVLVPVIILSGQSNKEVMAHLIQLGAIDYVSKDDEYFLDNAIDSTRRAIELINSKRS